MAVCPESPRGRVSAAMDVDAGMDMCRQCWVAAKENERNFCAACWNQACVMCGQWQQDLKRVERWTHEEYATTSRQVWLCCFCRQTTTETEVRALAAEPAFTIWYGRCREDSMVPQPAKILPWLFLGDLDDALNMTTLGNLDITAVLSLCPEYHNKHDVLKFCKEHHHSDMPGLLKANKIELQSLEAEDDKSGNYDIVREVWPQAVRHISRWSNSNQKVLVNCYGGVNRSAAIVVAWLISMERLSLCDAIHRCTAVRGTVLTNFMYRLQLLRLWRQLSGVSDEGLS